MKKILLVLSLFLAPAGAMASSGHLDLDSVDIDLGDKASLQNGARIFVNYCVSCHSAAYMRYNRMGQDIGISDAVIKDNMLFAGDKVGDPMKAAMPPEDAKKWFGTAPPDLSLEARLRSPDWLYSYMRGFYKDDSAPSGWNNTVFKNVAMPHVLYAWQGTRAPVYKKDEHGHEMLEGFETVKAGTMSEEEFDSNMRDLVNFMVYMGEPAKMVRYKMGFWILAFLAVFFVVSYLLKKEFWKDVH